MASKRPAVMSGLDDAALWQLLDFQEDEVLVVDPEYRVGFANSALLGRVASGGVSTVGRPCYEAFEARQSPCRAPLWLCPLEKVLQSGNDVSLIHPRPRPSGETGPVRYLKITWHPLKDEHGDVRAVVEVRRDVTAARELESQILRRHHYLYALNLISGAVSALWDLDTILNMSLGIALEIVNGESGGILLLDSRGRNLSYRVHRGLSPKYAERVRVKVGEGIVGMVARNGEPVLMEDVSQDPRAVYRDLVSAEGLKGFASVPLKTKDRVVGVMNVASHMPGRFTEDDLFLLNSIGFQIGTAVEQSRLYDRLAKARERYRVLLRHSLTAQEEERKRIARELHDDTSQALTSLALSLQAIIGMAEMKGIDHRELLDRLRKTHANAVQAGNEIVQLMKELRPTLLDELGMATAIRRYAKDMLDPQGISVTTEFSGTDQRFRPEVEVTLFRIAQGVIGNILEHSGASHAVVKLECDSRQCTLRVQDDGKGFEVDKLTRVDQSGRGAGLFTMKERVKLVGGHCRVSSHVGKGTTVTVKVPSGRDLDDETDKGADS